jgi:hypothetical protein
MLRLQVLQARARLGLLPFRVKLMFRSLGFRARDQWGLLQQQLQRQWQLLEFPQLAERMLQTSGGWLSPAKQQVIRLYRTVRHQAGPVFQAAKLQAGQLYQAVKRQVIRLYQTLKQQIGKR